MRVGTKLSVVLSVAVLVAACLGAARADVDPHWYIVSSAFDNTGADGFWYYTYELFGVNAGDQTLSQWWLLIPGVSSSSWSEVGGLLSSPRPPEGNWPYGGDWSDASGYTNGYSWVSAAPDVHNGVPAVWWLAADIKNSDQDGSGVPEAWEPGVNSGYLASYALGHVPLPPDSAENTDVPAGWFQMQSKLPPQWVPYVIQDGEDQWKGMALAPIPEPGTLALLGLGLPGLALLRRRRGQRTGSAQRDIEDRWRTRHRA